MGLDSFGECAWWICVLADREEGGEKESEHDLVKTAHSETAAFPMKGRLLPCSELGLALLLRRGKPQLCSSTVHK